MSQNSPSSHSDSRRKSKWLRRLTITLLVLLLFTAMGGYLGYVAFTWIPREYEQQLVLSPVVLEQASDELEQRVLNLHTDVQEAEQWEATFTDQQINGWLEVDLDKKFPRLLPSNVRKPRISFTDDAVHLACQYQSPKMSTVLSLEFDPYVTDEENVVAVRLRSAKIGAVPGLVKMAVDQISMAARRAKLDLRWAQEEGDPVALISIPHDLVDDDHNFMLRSIELLDGSVRIAGRTQEKSSGVTDVQAESVPSGLLKTHSSDATRTARTPSATATYPRQ